MNNLKTLIHSKIEGRCSYMYLKYSTGFLIASLVQAGIIMTSEKLGISSLGAKLTAMQLLTHILAGQAVGYILLLIMRKIEMVNEANFWIIGSITGIVAWLVLLSINSSIGKVNAPWNEGFSTVLASIIAFLAMGIISSYTIKTTTYDKIKE